MTRINMRVSDELRTAMCARGETLSDGVRDSLERYYYLLERSRTQMAELFDRDELVALCAVGNGTLFEAHTIEGLLWNMEDAIAGEEIELSEDQKAALLDKLRGLTLTQHAALVDAVERFWRAKRLGVCVDPGTILRELDAVERQRAGGEA